MYDAQLIFSYKCIFLAPRGTSAPLTLSIFLNLRLVVPLVSLVAVDLLLFE